MSTQPNTSVSKAGQKTRSVDKLNRDLQHYFKDEDFHNAVNVLREGLKATQTVRTGRTEDGNIDYGEVPDNNARFRSAQLILAYGFGTPVSKTEITAKEEAGNQGDSPNEILQKLKDSGADIGAILSNYVENLPEASNDDQ